MYVYRALRPEEFYTNYLLCKDYFNDAPCVYLSRYNYKFGEDALDLVGSHIRYGSHFPTPWISCTKDFDKVKRYLYENNSDYNNGIAVIKNHDGDSFSSISYFITLFKGMSEGLSDEQISNNIRNLPLSSINKCVFDFSKGYSKKYNYFLARGYVNLRNSETKRTRMNSFEHNFSKASVEIIILGEIPSQDYYILDPLAIDFISYLKKQNLIGELNDDIILSVINNFRINHKFVLYGCSVEEVLYEPFRSVFNNFHPILKRLFYNLYIVRKQKNVYAKEIQVSVEYLDYLTDIMFDLILKRTNCLNEIILPYGNNKQIKLTTSC